MAIRTLPAAAAVALLAACTTPSEPFLKDTMLACHAGDPNACNRVPQLQLIVAIERQQQAAAVAALAEGIGRAADGIAAAQQSRHHR